MKKQSIFRVSGLWPCLIALFFVMVLVNANSAKGLQSPDSTEHSKIIDTIPPKIMLKGSQDVIICKWSIYVDAGYEICNNYCNNKAIKVTGEGSFADFNTLHEGLYLFRYKAVDSFGNIGYSDYRFVKIEFGTDYCPKTYCNFAELNRPAINFSIYPNPSIGKFCFKSSYLFVFDKGLQVIIYNMYGKVIFDRFIHSSFYFNPYQLDLTDYPAGLYTVKIIYNESPKYLYLNDPNVITKQVMITR